MMEAVFVASRPAHDDDDDDDELITVLSKTMITYLVVEISFIIRKIA